MPYCTNCGTEVEEGNSFCSECGQQVVEPVTAAASGEPPQVTETSESSSASAAREAETPAQAAGATSLVSALGPDAGPKIATIAAIAVLVGFVLPWISCPGLGNATGFDLATKGDLHALWIIPLSMMVTLVVLLATRGTSKGQTQAAVTAIAAGAASLLLMLYYYASLRSPGQRNDFGLGAAVAQAVRIEFGAFLSFLGSIGVVLGGILDFHFKNRCGP